MKVYSIFGSLFLVLFTVSCIKNRESKPIPKAVTRCNLNQLDSRDADSSYNFTYRFFFDSDRRLIRTKYYHHDLYYNPVDPNKDFALTEYEYEGDRLVAVRLTKNHWTELEYSNGEVSRVTEYFTVKSDTTINVYNYTYNNGLLTQVKLVEEGQDKGVIFTLEWAGDNISKVTEFEDGQMVEWHEYDQFDDKENFFSFRKVELYQGHLNINRFKYLNQNNIIHRLYGLNNPVSGWYQTWDFTLNADSVPNRFHTVDHWSDRIYYFCDWSCETNLE